MILCGLSGLPFVELSRLAFRECCTPCTMDVCRWCPYDCEGFLSTSALFFALACAAGVTPLGEALRGLLALSGLPLVVEGSREDEVRAFAGAAR